MKIAMRSAISVKIQNRIKGDKIKAGEKTNSVPPLPGAYERAKNKNSNVSKITNLQ